MTPVTLSTFSQPFILFSLFGICVSLVLFFKLKNHCSIAIRVSFLGGALISLAAGLFPYLSQILAVSFLPSAVYNVSNPMTVAPFIIGIVGFFGCWSFITLAQELYAILNRQSCPPRIATTLVALVIFAFMTRAIHHGTSDYHLVLNSQEISDYALSGTDPDKLTRLYREISRTNDTKLNNEILSLLAENRKSSPELLKMIYASAAYRDMDASIQNAILINLTKNPNTPSDILEKLLVSASKAHDVPSSSLAFIPRNPNFSDAMLVQLAYYPDCEIRRAIISYPHISENILNQMIHKDPDIGVRRDAKRRLDFLHGISHLDERKRPPVNIDMTQNKNLQQLAEQSFSPDKLKGIFLASEANQNPGLILENLASNCFIDDDLARKIYLKTSQIKNYARINILVALAANPKTPADILNQLAKQTDLAVLRALASNPSLPFALLAKLAPYPDCKIRKKIICHPDTSAEIITHMQKDPDQSVALESNTRLKESDYYLETCREVKKMNPSCQKFYDVNPTSFQLFPNTSETELPFQQWKNAVKTFLSFASSHQSAT